MNNVRSQSVTAEEHYIQYNVYTVLIRTVNQERIKHAKDNGMRTLRSEKGNGPMCKAQEYSSFSKRESPIALYISTVLLGVLRQESLKGLLRM